MQKTALAFIAILLLSACSKDKTGSYKSLNNTPPVDSGRVIRAGMFVPTAGITVTGTAKIITANTSYSVVLDSFYVSAGPDLKVYLSKNDTPTDFINLGPLRMNAGNDTYSIPVTTDLPAYKYVLIHCQHYNHLFAVANLKP